MSSHPSGPSPSLPEGDRRAHNRLDETSGFEHLPNTDETSAFENKKSDPSRRQAKKSSSPSVGGYEIGDMLGQGGMGRVFRAGDSTGRSVALKLLSPDLARSPEALARFKQEGLIASQINHPNCVFVHRVDDDSGTPFIAMELMTGQTLKDLVLQKGPLPYAEAVRLILQCIDGLIEAHSLGMIHRDIKPANCYLDGEGNVKIGDFGLARSLVSDSELTQTGAFLGTPLFASPEQLLGQTIDGRSDIYSLTATLYYLLAGKAPFESPHAAQVIARIASSDPPKFKSAGVDVPPPLEQIVMKGLSRDASKRYATFSQMRDDLQKIIEPTSQPTSLTRRAFAWVLDYAVKVALTTLFLISLGNLSELRSNPIWANLAGMIITFVYFVFSESVFAATLGKMVMRIQVVDAKTGGHPKFTSVLIRAFLAMAFSSTLFVLTKWMVPDLSPLSETLLVTATTLLNTAILCSTWWHSGKRQMAHDWCSGTECRTRLGLRAAIRSSVELPRWSVPTIPIASAGTTTPKQLGRFTISNEIRCKEPVAGIKWLVGQDPQLERSVWLACLTNKTTEFENGQSQKPKSMRLRFIEEGVEPEFRWFAYVALDGVPLSECYRQGMQFPWPITRSILGEVVAIADSPKKFDSGLEYRLDVNRIWVDSVGRLCIVDFECSETEKTEFVSLVSKIGLPARHRLRKSFAKGSKPFVPVESLPPLTAVKLLESIASSKYTPSMANLKLDLEKVDKRSHELTPRARFASAAIGLGLISPILFISILLFVVQSVVLISDGIYKENRKLKSLLAYSENPEEFTTQWQLVSEKDRSYWTDGSKKNEIDEALKIQTERLQVALGNVGLAENIILKSAQSILLDNAPIYGSKPDSPKQDVEVPNGESPQKIKVSAGGMNVVEVNFGNEKIDAELMQSILESVERSKSPLPVSKERVPAFAFVAVAILICTLWTTLTYGGVSRLFSGLCLMRRDGRQLGILRSFWRACVFFAPFLVLAYLVSCCNSAGYEWLWWGTQLKRVSIILPFVYLATTLIGYRRTPLDVLTGTVAVAR